MSSCHLKVISTTLHIISVETLQPEKWQKQRLLQLWSITWNSVNNIFPLLKEIASELSSQCPGISKDDNLIKVLYYNKVLEKYIYWP
jgi:hypothetical protein